MQKNIKGFDTITAWITALVFAGIIFSTIWWYGKKSAEKNLRKEKSQLSRVEKDLKNFSLLKSSKQLREQQSHSQEDEGTSSMHRPVETLENWGYSGNIAPWYWPQLNDRFTSCGKKAGQSPIDISGARLDESLKSLKFYYKHGITHLTLHHQTVQGDIDRGSYIEWDGERFDLMKVFFRTPSEHKVNALPWEMEVQLEHKAVTGKLIMVSTLIKIGHNSDIADAITSHLPEVKDEINNLSQTNWLDLFPQNRTYWTYMGSSTYPPCQEDVRWIIFTNQTAMSKRTIDRFFLLQKNNVRPVSSLGKRELNRSNR